MRGMVALLKIYQIAISPLLAPRCRFWPTCSAYGVEAIQSWGPWRGGWLTLRRVARCHPWTRGGIDHVPQPCPGRHPCGCRQTPSVFFSDLS